MVYMHSLCHCQLNVYHVLGNTWPRILRIVYKYACFFTHSRVSACVIIIPLVSTGGPGTGKVTLSEAVAQRSNGRLAHISMAKVLKDYAKHFGQ